MKVIISGFSLQTGVVVEIELPRHFEGISRWRPGKDFWQPLMLRSLFEGCSSPPAPVCLCSMNNI